MRSRVNKNKYQKNKSLFSRGFTVIELIVVVVVIAILASIVVFSYSSWRLATVTAQLKSDLSNAASAMENYRTFNNVYPTSVPSSFTPSSGVTLSGGSPDGGITYCVSAVNTQAFPNLFYHIDSTNNGTGATSGACPSVASCTLTVNAGTGGTVSGGGSYTCDTLATITATPSTYYSFVNWTGNSVCTGVASHTVTMTSNITCTANFTPTPIATPAAPTVTQSTVGATTTFTWGATTCASSQTAGYQYDYTISPSGFNSGWTATASTSAAFTTSTQGQTYALAVQAQCYNAVTSSSWSSSGTASYHRNGSWLSLIATSYDTSCSIAANNLAYCWGQNADGQLGNNTTISSSVPTAVNTSGVLSGKTILSIAASTNNTCALASDHEVYCWGQNNNGQLGNNTTTQSLVPVAVSTSGVLSGKTVLALSGSGDTFCAIASDNNAYCWGWGYYGQLGNNATSDSSVPVAVSTSGVLSGKTIKYISASEDHVCAIASDNNAYCWGDDNEGALGNNSSTSSSVPVAVNTSGVLSGKTLTAISSGWDHTCAIASDSNAYCWGYNEGGQLGNNTTTQSLVPVAVSTSGVLSGKTILSLATGVDDTCAIASNNLAYCWGDNADGNLGNNSTTNALVPVAVYTSGVLSGLTINAISTSWNTCVIASDGNSYCWGYNSFGQLGNNISGVNVNQVPVATYPPY